MSQLFYDRDDNKLYIVGESGAVKALTAVASTEAAAAEPAPATKQRKWHKANKAGGQLQKEIEADHQASGRKSRVSDEDKAEVEAALIDGMGIPACYEKYGERLGVTSAWFYVLRTRLRNEGKITS